ncbi:hypothetical protein Vretimale_2137 [Volvox reticuliferus]|uniref:Uncharacterized protein n=1 Tax=Volvox reticuliferus TaxID=1737510 RepID=A0A8J4FGV2_9CHLO|nr:hypothetical protein Vretifemale_4422 [Volvox reticuliferus]GIL96300.1 hypothetical protein Vretimale_2137 [Volvox reticuliferus]
MSRLAMLRCTCTDLTGPRTTSGNPWKTQRVAIPRRSISTSAGYGSTHQQLKPVRVYAPNDDIGGQLDAEVLTSPGSHVFTVSLKKPFGLVLTERGGSIVVESITPGGHASAAGIVAGDVLLATSARAQVDTGNGALRGQLVLLSTAGEKFSTVAAAIRSNTCSQCNVHLVLERPEGSVKPIS